MFCSSIQIGGLKCNKLKIMVSKGGGYTVLLWLGIIGDYVIRRNMWGFWLFGIRQTIVDPSGVVIGLSYI